MSEYWIRTGVEPTPLPIEDTEHRIGQGITPEIATALQDDSSVQPQLEPRSANKYAVIGASIVTVAALSGTGLGAVKLKHELQNDTPAVSCPAVTLQTRQVATRILAQPNVNPLPPPENRLQGPPTPSLYQARRTALFGARQAAAQKHNLTVHSPVAYQSVFKPTNRLRLDLPTSTYLSATNTFLKPYNIKVETKKPESAGDEARQATAAELKKPEVKNTLYNLVDAVSGVPEEAITQSGLRRIYLVHIPSVPARSPLTGDMQRAAYVIHGKSQAMYYNSALAVAPGIFHHEWQHLRDCDNQNPSGHQEDDDKHENHNAHLLDPEYTAYNADEAYGQTDPQDMEDYDKSVPPLNRELKAASQTNNMQLRCRLLQTHAKEAKNTRWISPYSNTDVVEDKGEVGSTVTRPETWNRMLDGRHPAITGKFGVLFERYLQRSPDAAAYFADLAYRGRTPYDLDATAWQACHNRAT